MTITLATAPRTNSKLWPASEVTWPELVARLDLENPADRKEAGGYVLGKLRDDRRTKNSVLSRSPVLVLDADSARPSLPEELDTIHRYAAWWHTTWSHGVKGCRYRVGVQASREMTPDEYERAAVALMRRLGVDQFDLTSAQASRLMFWPATQDRAAYASGVVDGEPVDVDELLAEYAEDAARTPAEAASTTPGDAGGPQALDAVESAPEDVVRRQIDLALTDLDHLAALPDGGRMPWPNVPEGVGWDLGVFYAAQRLVEAANSSRSYTLDDAGEDYMKHAPAADGTYNPEHKWASAVRAVGTRGVPYEGAADVFGPDSGVEQTADDDRHERAIRDELERLMIRDEAHRRFEALRRPPASPWDAGTLTEQLAKPQPPAARVEGLIPWSASALIIAQRKTGKTTLMLNLARCLLTGADFLGRPVRKVAGRVALLNFEVSGPQVATWADEAGVPRDGLFVVNLRGASNPFSDPARLAELAALLRSQRVETLIVDPFGRAFTGESQNDAGEVQRWLVALDQFARTEVGALDVLLAVHAGWNGERARGSSALEDWADAMFYLTRDEDTADRYLRVEGRDVELDEDRLLYDSETRALSLAGLGSRKQAKAGRKADELVEAVVSLVSRTPGLKAGEVETHLREAGFHLQKGEGSRAARLAASQGLLRSEPGARNAVHYHPVSPMGGTK